MNSNISINLAQNKNEEYEQKVKRLKIVRLIAAFSLILVVLCSLIIFILDLSVPLANIKKNEETTLSNLSVLHGKLAKLYLINDRITYISDIEAKRKNYVNTIQTITDKLPAAMKINSLSIDQKTLVLTASGQSLLDVDTFLNSFIDLGNNAKLIKGVTIENIVANVNNLNYTITLQAQVL